MALLQSLPLKTDQSGRLWLDGQDRPVHLELDYGDVTISTEQYTVLHAGIVDVQDQLLMKVFMLRGTN